ncbi:unnamed protein product [Pylaiella littoralis]
MAIRLPSMLSTPEKDEGGPRTRSHTTPTTSDRALESDRCAPRPRVSLLHHRVRGGGGGASLHREVMLLRNTQSSS